MQSTAGAPATLIGMTNDGYTSQNAYVSACSNHSLSIEFKLIELLAISRPPTH